MPEEKEMTKKSVGWKKRARIEACMTCKHYRRLGNYCGKLICSKFGFRTCRFGICDHFEMDA
jgi:hypothetical protein